MGKIYTLDGKYLTERPDIRIGDRLFAVDDRKKTVQRLIEMSNSDNIGIDTIDDAIRLGMGNEVANEIEEMDLSFAAYSRIFELLIAAATGQAVPEDGARFPVYPENGSF